MRTETITCDQCEADLTHKRNSVDYRLVLAAEAKPGAPGVHSYTGAMKDPPVDRTHHFCGLDCLVLWLEPKRAEVMARAARRTTPAPG